MPTCIGQQGRPENSEVQIEIGIAWDLTMITIYCDSIIGGLSKTTDCVSKMRGGASLAGAASSSLSVVAVIS